MKSSHSHCKRLYCTAEGFNAQQTALLHSRQLYCTAEGFTAPQKALLHSRWFYCTTGSFAAQQKSQSCGRNWRKFPFAAGIGEKFLLRQKQRISPLCSVFPRTWTQCLRKTWQRQNGTLKPILQSARPDFFLRKRNVKRTLDTLQVWNEESFLQIRV